MVRSRMFDIITIMFNLLPPCPSFLKIMAQMVKIHSKNKITKLLPLTRYFVICIQQHPPTFIFYAAIHSHI